MLAFSASPAALLLAKATVLLVVAFAATRVMSRVSAVTRHTVWLVSMSALLLIPAMYALTPLRLPILPAQLLGQLPEQWQKQNAPSAVSANSALRGVKSDVAVSTRALDASGDAGVLRETRDASGQLLTQELRGTDEQRSSTTPGTAAPTWTWSRAVTTMLVIWLVVAAALTLWLCAGLLMVRRIVRRASSVDDAEWTGALYEMADRMGLEHAPTVLRSEEITMPFACGFRRPMIVLPAESAAWTADERTAVLLHELAHIKRRDIVAHTLSRITCALYWFHPLVWTAARRLRAESEQACDDLALLSGARASDYAEHLLEIVTRVKHRRTPSLAMAMATRSEFEGRMLAILDPERRRRGPSRMQSATLVASLLMLTVVVGLATPAASRAAEPKQAARLRDSLSQDSTSSARVARSPRPASGADSVVNAPVSAASAAPASMPVQPPEPAANPVAPRGISTLMSDGRGKEERAFDRAEVRQADREAERAGKAMVSALLSGVSAMLDRAPAAVPGTKRDSSARVATLCTVLRADANAELRRVSAWGLESFITEPAAVEALVQALRRDSDPSVREMAAWALSSADPNAIVRTALIASARSEQSPLVLRSVVRALGEQSASNDQGVVDALVAVLEARGAGNASLREITAWAFGNVAPARAPSALIALLRDPESSVRKTTAWALHETEDAQAVPALAEAIRVESSRDVQQAMVRALASMGEPAVPALTKLIDDKDAAVRAQAIRALAGTQMAGGWPMPRPEPRPFPDNK